MAAGLTLVPLLILMNAFFVAAEYAVVAVRGPQIDAMRAGGRRRAADAMARLKAEPAAAIGAIQVCITMTNLLIGWIGEPAMSQLLRVLLGPLGRVIPAGVFTTIALVVSFVVVTLLTVVFSELLPKAMTLRYVPTVAAATAVPVHAILRGTRPLVRLMNAMANAITVPLGLGRVDTAERDWHTAEEIKSIIAGAADHGELSGRERSLVLNSLALGRRTAKQIVVPRVKIVYVDVRKSMDDNRAVLTEHLHTLVPLCDGGLDNVVGVVAVKEFLAAHLAAGDASVLRLIARPAVFVPETIPIDQLLLAFDENRTEMVFLVDEHGGVEGLVTLRDVVDELIGHPLHHEPPGAGPAAEAPRIVNADLPLRELAATFGMTWTVETTAVTVGGLIADDLGRIPAAGDEVRIDGLAMTVLEADARAARRVEVRRAGSAPPQGERP